MRFFLTSMCLLLLINVSFSSISDDPCYNYESLDRPWRATNETGLNICDEYFSWSGWYRLYHYGMNIQMSDTCVNGYSCNSYSSLSLNGPHPQIEDGVVVREVCVGYYRSVTCCDYKSKPIRVKACPGNYYVYELVKPLDWCSGYCTDVSTITPKDPTTIPAVITGSSVTFISGDPCSNYNILDDSWRNTHNYWYINEYLVKHDDTLVKWDGWYRLFINGSSAQIPEGCFTHMYCGGVSSLYLGGSHPRVEDGVVTRQVYGSFNEQCSRFTSNPIQVKACPGDYYVYELTRPDLAIPLPSYCAVSFSSISDDPCYNYESLDRPWREINESGLNICDNFFSWSGWYRLYHYGMNIQMSDTCVNGYSCNSYSSLSLNGPHPQIEDGVVVREVCRGNYWSGTCCYYKSKPIRVKACPGNYYVYELVKPLDWCSGYCTDVSTITPKDPTTIPAVITGSSVTFISGDPCSNYNILDDYRRNTHSDWNMNYYFDKYDDTRVKWDGWYRLFINGSSAQIPEWCFDFMYCGGVSSLYLGGSHPQVEDGVVTRQVYGSYYEQCSHLTSNPIQVKACPGDYYVYELTRPDLLIPAPSYCAVSFSSISDDPCYNYESLDRPWRATNESGSYICEQYFSWSGWYRLYHYGMNIQMSETCVNESSCNSGGGLWLNGPHPQIKDGVVVREVCGWYRTCCDYKSKPIRVKACPGNYYVYELVRPPDFWCSGYCTDVSTITPKDPTTIPAVITGSSVTFSDPCSNYNILDDYRRNTHNDWNINEYLVKHDDTREKWDGWYRLFIDGSSAQMPEWCFTYMSCGGFSSLYLGSSHPQVEDGVVTRQVYGSFNGQCSRFTSNPIQVKACPGDYYVYELTRPDLLIPSPSYCAVSFNTPSVDPCDSYTSLDEPWRSSDHYYNDHAMCDYNVEWNGWYRLFISGQSAQMSESCGSEGMCGTYNPLYLRDPHPQLEDGVVTRHVCMFAYEACCLSESHPIRVKACPGDYYVYEFVKPLQCAAYCAEDTGFTTLTPTTQTTETPPTEHIAPPITSTAERELCSELNCTEDERCGEKNGVYGCFCNQNQTRSEPHSFDFSETCESSSGSISLSRCQLFEAGFSAHVLHLNEPSCRGTIQNGRVQFYFDNNDHICGTNLVANGSHIIYENFILGTPESAAGLISRGKILKLNFSCIYPQTQTLSMIDINPLETRVNKNLPAGEGRYQVRMIPYQDSEFSQPFTGHVESEIDEKMFVEVGVDGVDSRQFVTVIDTCWATPVNDPDYSLRWDLITGECPNPQDNTVELLQNGNSTSSRFSFRMFIFKANFTKVYLHCSVHLCLLTNNHCSADCYSGFHQRMGRSLDFYDSSSISMGPLVWSDGNSDALSPETVIKSGASGLCGCLIILLVSLLNAHIIF